MAEGALFIELIKYAGFPAIIFAVWFIYHRSQSLAWSEQTKLHFETFSLITKERDVRDERNYEILKEMLEVSRYQSTILARMDSKIDTNQYCPIVRQNTHA
ncbi:MAG: hypothetical protein C4529_08925 [Deltaproteobacteria bacterium]|nr:MAG: hypothetical protein C4529_08925 [Deltaproteobacteria bacterium]